VVCCVFCYAQDKTNTSYFDVNYFKGHIAEHNKTLLHLIKDRPEGVILSWNKQTYGNKDWEQRFNYPDYGASFVYQDLKNDVLGNNYAVYGHYNFYFFKRNVLLRIAQGVAYNTNPYDRVTNSKNIAFGSSILSSADKRINKVSALQFGTDVFFSNFLKAHIAFKGASFPEEDISGDEDYRRVGVFAGHELFINKLSVISQVGYYVYYPFDFEGRVYLRAGFKYYFTNRFFTNIAIKSHGAKAEAIEFGVGVRL